MNEIPQRDLYGIPGDDSLDFTTAEDAIGDWLDHHLLTGEDPPDEFTITCANYVRDENGEPFEAEEEGFYETTGREEVTINLREWCKENNAMHLIHDGRHEQFRVYTNGEDYIIGTSAREAAEVHCCETGDSVEEYLKEYGPLVACPDDKELTIANDDDNCGVVRKRTKTMREWVTDQMAITTDTNGNFTRLLCSKNY